MTRIHSNNCAVGDYVVIMASSQHGDAYGDYVTAEKEANVLARKHPGKHVFVAQINTQLLGVPHVYEVHGKE